MSVSYISLIIRLQALKTQASDLRDAPGSIDALIRQSHRNLKLLLLEHGVPAHYVDLVLLRYRAASLGLSDQEIRTCYLNYVNDAIVSNYVRVLLDFYALEVYLRTGDKPTESGGYLEPGMFVLSESVQGLVQKSPYYRKLQSLSLRNYRSLFDELLYQEMVSPAGDPVNLEAVFALAVQYCLVLENERIIAKAQKRHRDVTEWERCYHG